MLRRTTMLLLAGLALGGCASAASGPEAMPGAARAPRRDSSVIGPEELAAAVQEDLFQAIQQLRPAFLLTRGGPQSLQAGATAEETIQVYLDGVLIGSPERLHELRPSGVREVRKLSAADATQKYGTNHRMGAILVTQR